MIAASVDLDDRGEFRIRPVRRLFRWVTSRIAPIDLPRPVIGSRVIEARISAWKVSPSLCGMRHSTSRGSWVATWRRTASAALSASSGWSIGNHSARVSGKVSFGKRSCTRSPKNSKSSGIEVEFIHDIAGVFRGDPKSLLGGSQRILGLPAFGDIEQGGAHADCLAGRVAHQDVVDFDPQLTAAAPEVTALVGFQGPFPGQISGETPRGWFPFPPRR